MKKYKIVKYKDIGNWFVYKRYFLFFWSQVNYFISYNQALEYVGKESSKIINKQL